ncbi:hypothetical protein [uncultured Propionibacterium sp.]|uniref:hypothetical protein n=1 Tax=uncultured Propionibacterium sp. TaxID=218066 RepID=UPI00292DDC2C|nr:hypothetical protein [uncultured Propionibacterium sp.]
MDEVLTLTDECTGQEHRLTVAGTRGNSTDVRVCMSREALNGMLGRDAGSFNGYPSDAALDLPEGSVASTMTEQDARTATLTVATSLLVSPALVIGALKRGIARVFIGYDANFVLTVPAAMVAEEITIAFGAYSLVAGPHPLHVRRIPLGEALRLQE